MHDKQVCLFVSCELPDAEGALFSTVGASGASCAASPESEVECKVVIQTGPRFWQV
jgi:hypothetical protein